MMDVLKTVIIVILPTALALSAFAQKPSGGVPVGEETPATQPDRNNGDATLTGTLVVLNKAEASASLIDLSNGSEVARLDTGAGPHEVAVSPDGRTAVVCDYGQRDPGNSLTVIDLESRQVTRTIDLGEYHRPHGIVFLPGRERVVVTAEQERKLLVVNITTGEVEKAMDTDARVSHMVAITPDASRAFVANIGSGSMTAFDLNTAERLAVIPTGEGAEGIDVTPDGDEVWVTNRSADTISVIDAQSLEIIDTIASAKFPIRVRFTPDGKRALVSNAVSGDVAVFDAATRSLVKRIPMDEEIVDDDAERLFADNPDFQGSPVPIGILIMPDGSHAFIANTQADVVSVIDLDSLRVVGRLKAGKEPDGLGYSPLVLRK